MPIPPRLLAAVAVLVVLPMTAPAQARTGRTADTVPDRMLPPAGKCRIWMSGVPAPQQPAPTDCATALRQRPANGIVLYGPSARETGRERFDPRAGVTPAKPQRESTPSQAKPPAKPSSEPRKKPE